MSTCLGLRAPRPLAIVAFALVLSACGGDGDGKGGSANAEPESDLPAPPSGKATIGGILTINGEARSGEDVTLGGGTATEGMGGTTGASGPTGPTVATAADGSFVFEGVEPGTYSLGVGVLVEDAFSTDAFGLSWDDPCRADGFQVLNGAVSDESTGEPIGVIAAASSEVTSTNADQVTPIEVAAGDRITQDIALVCETGT
jgi:hypothetical protein